MSQNQSLLQGSFQTFRKYLGFEAWVLDQLGFGPFGVLTSWVLDTLGLSCPDLPRAQACGASPC